MIKKKVLVAAGSERLADILISTYNNNKDIQKQLDISFAALSENPKKIVSLIKKEITSLKRSSKFIDYYESTHFSERLDSVRESISNDLLKKSPQHALDLMTDFLNCHEKTLDRVDDSNGNVGDVFRIACNDLALIFAKLEKPVDDVVSFAFDRFMKNEYGIYDEIIPSLKDALKNQGLNKLKDKLEKEHNGKNTLTIKSGLKNIADSQKDVDSFISACSFGNPTCAYDHLSIAKRLIEQWRAEEALKWLEKMNISQDHPWERDRIKLKIQALDLSGNYELAQMERIKWFDEAFSPEVYSQIMSHAKPEFKESFKQKSIEKAFKIATAHAGLEFLTRIQEIESCSQLIRQRIDEFHGRSYKELRSAATLLKDIDPLASTLLYRKLIEPILETAQSKYYNYAAKDLVGCYLLSKKIDSWENFENHDQFLEELKDKHRRKVSFWPKYNEAIHKAIKTKA